MKKRIKTNGVLIFLAVAAIAAFHAVFLRSYSSCIWERIAGITGMSLILLGQLIRVSARGYKAENSGEGNFLIQGGPYMLVRNPMYLGIILIGAGIVLFLFEWWVAGIFIFAFIMRYILLIFKEEKKLSGLFPGAYQDYCKRVPRLMPSAAIMFKSGVRQYLPLKLSWFKKEISSIIPLLLFVLLVKAWVDIRAAGIEAYFEEAKWLLLVIALFMCFAGYLNGKKDAAAGKNG